MSSLRARLPAWAPYAVAGAWLLAGWLWLVRGAAHPGVPYRPWAFDHHAYSDLLAMGGDRYFGGGRPVPWLEDRIEYPPILVLAIWGASFAPGGPAGYFTAGYLALSAAVLLSVRLLRLLPGADPWWWAATPAIAWYAGLNWDAIPIALFLAAALALERGREARAGALAALGVSAKIFPAALLPGAAGALLGRARRRPLAALAAAFALASLLVNLPVAALSPSGWAFFWRHQAARAAENSAWEALRQVPGLARLADSPAFLGAATGLLVLAASALAARGAFRARPEPSGRAPRLAAALALVAWVAVNKVWSPQYFLWVFAAAALAAAPFRLFWPLSALAIADYHLAFEVRSSRGTWRSGGLVYTAEELVRTAMLLGLAWWLGRELWRERRREEPGA